MTPPTAPTMPATGATPCRTGKRAMRLEGFSLDANTAVAEDNRGGLEKICSCGMRPPFSQQRLSLEVWDRAGLLEPKQDSSTPAKADGQHEATALAHADPSATPTATSGAGPASSSNGVSGQPSAPATPIAVPSIGFVQRPEVRSCGLFQRDDLALAVVFGNAPGSALSCRAALRDRREWHRLRALVADHLPLVERPSTRWRAREAGSCEELSIESQLFTAGV